MMSAISHILRECKLDSYWSLPFTCWTRRQLSGLGHIIRYLTVLFLSNPTRPRHNHWRKWAHLTGLKPSKTTSPTDIFGPIGHEYGLLDLLNLFVTKIYKPKEARATQVSLHMLTRTLSIASWNCGGIASSSTRMDKVNPIQRLALKGTVLLQETKITTVEHHMKTKIKMAYIRTEPAVQQETGVHLVASCGYSHKH